MIEVVQPVSGEDALPVDLLGAKAKEKTKLTENRDLLEGPALRIPSEVVLPKLNHLGLGERVGDRLSVGHHRLELLRHEVALVIDDAGVSAMLGVGDAIEVDGGQRASGLLREPDVDGQRGRARGEASEPETPKPREALFESDLLVPVHVEELVEVGPHAGPLHPLGVGGQTAGLDVLRLRLGGVGGGRGEDGRPGPALDRTGGHTAEYDRACA